MGGFLSRQKRLILEIVVLFFLLGIGGSLLCIVGNYAYVQGYSDGYHTGIVSGEKQGYQQGYADASNVHSNDYANGYSVGYGQGKNDALSALLNWYASTGCEQTSSGYISFKIWQDLSGNYQYTCLVSAW